MNVIILGAGASKSYDDSSTGEKMPIATDFFSTFNRLKISENTWVLVGAILNYLKDHHNIDFEGFRDYDKDIEEIHSEIEARLSEALERQRRGPVRVDDMMITSAYVELIFLFTSVINEIQNGPVSKPHLNLVHRLNSSDVVLTFNWDTLMDRALQSETSWTVENGYFIQPSQVYRDKWVSQKSDSKNEFPLLIKLHGSTNWLTSYLIAEDGQFRLLQAQKREDFFIYESTINPYNTYDGRFMNGYQDFSYGYYPPNLPVKGKKIRDGNALVRIILRTSFNPKGISEDKGLVSMPLIIPPVREKKYDLFGDMFTQLWTKGEEAIVTAKKIIIIGYSFPKTDVRTNELLKGAFLKRKSKPDIILIDPNPDQIVERFKYGYGIPSDKISVYREHFTEDFSFDGIL